MAIINDTKQTVARFKTYIDRWVEMCRKRNVASVWALASALRDRSFRREWNAVWPDVIAAEGGKLGLSTALAITGAVLGGVGIAAGGGAIGLPLALLLTPVGFLAGQEADSEGWTAKAVNGVKKFFGIGSHATDTPNVSPETPVAERVADEELSAVLTLIGDVHDECSAIRAEISSVGAALTADITRRVSDSENQLRKELSSNSSTIRAEVQSIEVRLRACESADEATSKSISTVKRIVYVLAGVVAIVVVAGIAFVWFMVR